MLINNQNIIPAPQGTGGGGAGGALFLEYTPLMRVKIVCYYCNNNSPVRYCKPRTAQRGIRSFAEVICLRHYPAQWEL